MVYERPGTSHTAAADGGCSSALEEELRQLAVQRVTIDDLGFAYQLQLEEVLRASAENAGLAVSPKMFAPESEDCLQRRCAVEAQVRMINCASDNVLQNVGQVKSMIVVSDSHNFSGSPQTMFTLTSQLPAITRFGLQVALHNAALAAQADKAVAQKVYTEQAEQIQEASRDHELAKDLEAKGDIALAKDSSSTTTAARVRVICCAINSHVTGTTGYAAALCAPAGNSKHSGRAEFVLSASS